MEKIPICIHTWIEPQGEQYLYPPEITADEILAFNQALASRADNPILLPHRVEDIQRGRVEYPWGEKTRHLYWVVCPGGTEKHGRAFNTVKMALLPLPPMDEEDLFAQLREFPVTKETDRLFLSLWLQRREEIPAFPENQADLTPPREKRKGRPWVKIVSAATAALLLFCLALWSMTGQEGKPMEKREGTKPEEKKEGTKPEEKKEETKPEPPQDPPTKPEEKKEETKPEPIDKKEDPNESENGQESRKKWEGLKTKLRKLRTKKTNYLQVWNELKKKWNEQEKWKNLSLSDLQIELREIEKEEKEGQEEWASLKESWDKMPGPKGNQSNDAMEIQRIYDWIADEKRKKLNTEEKEQLEKLSGILGKWLEDNRSPKKVSIGYVEDKKIEDYKEEIKESYSKSVIHIPMIGTHYKTFTIEILIKIEGSQNQFSLKHSKTTTEKPMNLNFDKLASQSTKLEEITLVFHNPNPKTSIKPKKSELVCKDEKEYGTLSYIQQQLQCVLDQGDLHFTIQKGNQKIECKIPKSFFTAPDDFLKDKTYPVPLTPFKIEGRLEIKGENGQH